MIQSSPYSFVRFEHPTDSDVSLDIPYSLPAFEQHEAAFQFRVTIDRPWDQDIAIGIGDANGALVHNPSINAVVKSFKYKVTGLLSYTHFYLYQISLNAVITAYNQTVGYDDFKDILFDLGLELEGEYIYSTEDLDIIIVAEDFLGGTTTTFAGFELNKFWDKGYAVVSGLAFDTTDTPDCFTYCLLLPGDSVMGYTNKFKIVDEVAFTSLVTYSCDESAFDFIYDNSPNIVRLPIFLLKPQFPKKREVYRKSDGTQKLLNSLVEKEYEVETEQMPEVFHEAMAIMLGHDNVVIECPNIRETSVQVIEADTYNPAWEGEGILFAKGKGKLKVATFSHANSNCS